MKSSDASAKNFTCLAYSVSQKVVKSVLIINETLWKNNPKCVKDVSIIYVNFTVTAIVLTF